MLRALLVMTLLAATYLSAADISGRWAGTIETNGSRVPIYLALNEENGRIVGSVSTGVNTKPVAIENAGLHDSEVAFEIRANANQPVRFRLTLTGGVLGGEATAGAQVSKVAVVQVGGGGDRAGLGAGTRVSTGVGGPAGVGDGFSSPALIHKVEPEYTEEARAAKFQGTVLLNADITRDGIPTNIKVARSLGLGLDEKAIEAVRQWKFKPAAKDGKAVTMTVTIEVKFHL
jgi:TonB family protein